MKKEVWKFKQSHLDLYDQYSKPHNFKLGFLSSYGEYLSELRKSKGKLEPFDPTATYVHPKHRVYIIRVDKNEHQKFQHKHSSRGPSDKYLTTESELTEESSEDEEDDDDYKGQKVRQQKARAAKKSSKKLRQTHLPFSPRKTRLGGRQRQIVSAGEESESEPQVRRRSGRNKAAGVRYDDDYQMDVLDGSDDAPVSTRTKKAKKKFKKRGPKPAYGIIRTVEDLDESDDEFGPLRAHRDFCEKCKDPPAHILMVQAKRKRGKKRAKQDEDEESDGERASKLGGWVRW